MSQKIKSFAYFLEFPWGAIKSVLYVVLVLYTSVSILFSIDIVPGDKSKSDEFVEMTLSPTRCLPCSIMYDDFEKVHKYGSTTEMTMRVINVVLCLIILF